MPPALGLKHKPVIVDYFIEFVASGHCVMENIFKYQEHLVRAYAGCFVAQLAYMLHYVFSVSSSCLRLSLLTE